MNQEKGLTPTGWTRRPSGRPRVGLDLPFREVRSWGEREKGRDYGLSNDCILPLPHHFDSAYLQFQTGTGEVHKTSPIPYSFLKISFWGQPECRISDQEDFCKTEQN